MTRVISLNCINCGANLEISEDMTSFACGHCGSQQIVERRGGTVILKPLVDAISKVQVGTDKTASEMAIQRLNKDIEDLNSKATRRRALAAAELEKVKNLCILTAACGVAVALFFVSKLGCPGALIIFGVALALTFYQKYQQSKPINEALEDDLESMRADLKTIQEKIGKHKAIVDT